MSSSHGALVVFGSGPGVGRNVAALFAERGFEKVILMSRDANRLGQDADFVRSACAETTVQQVAVDLADSDDVQRSLEEVDESLKGTSLECVLFNAARLGKSDFFKFPAGHLEQDLKISIVSLYTAAQWAMPQLLKSAAANSNATASFLVTSGMLAKDPAPAMFSLAACKAGQYNLVTSLHKEFEPKGVHCALIVIAGGVSAEAKVTNPRNIAESAWTLFTQSKGKGDVEVVLMDPAYAEHVKRREQANRN